MMTQDLKEEVLLSYLYEGLMAHWVSDQIETGAKLHPCISQRTGAMFEEDYSSIDVYADTSEIVSACALGYALLASDQGNRIRRRVDFAHQSELEKRAVAEALGAPVNHRIDSTAEVYANWAFDTVRQSVISMNDSLAMNIPNIVARLRRRSAAVQRMLNMSVLQAEVVS